MHQIRAVTLTGYVEVANFVGLDGRRMLREAGLSPELLENHANRLPAAAAVELLDRSVRQSRCESFGLLMAECRTFASLGPISLLLEHCADVRAVVRAVIGHQRHFNDVIELSADDAGDLSLVRYDLLPEFWSAPLLDLMVGIAYRILSSISGNGWKPESVHFVRGTPKDLAAWRRFFPAPVEFESSFNGFACSHAAMRIVLPQADAELAGHARDLLRLVPIQKGPAPLRDRVQRAITLLMPSGRATLEQVAAQMGLSPRGLQRRLEEEGVQFGMLLSEVRAELATAYLAGSSRPITSVAGLLGYASPSSFTRWFAGAYGVSPQEWRARCSEMQTSATR
jgi:AraC-like DNA-binding protein